MFKKIEIWILYLVVLLGIPLTIVFGMLVRHELLGGKSFGQVAKTALFLAEIPVNLKRLFTNNFDLQVEDRFPLLDGFSGTPNPQESYLLLSKYDGDLKEGIVELVDLTNFKVLHTWNPDIDEFNQLVENTEEFKFLKRDANNKRIILKHPLLLKDGGLVFKNHSPLVKIDNCSNLIYQNTYDQFHHSAEKDVNGDIWVPSNIYPQSLSIEKVGRENKTEGGYHDSAIVKLSPDGEIQFEKSVSQIFIDNGLEYLLFSVGGKGFNPNPIHLNDIQPVDFDGEFWKKGDLFLSLRHQSMVMLYRPSTNKIIWSGTGPFFHQHDVDILNDHQISVFNNNSKDLFISGTRSVVDGNNEVIIYDFKTDQYTSYLSDSLTNNEVKTITQGRSEILPNGDLFVEETNYGRTLFFNSDGSLRWTHVNRSEDGNIYSVGWSRILYLDSDIQIVNKFLNARSKCNN